MFMKRVGLIFLAAVLALSAFWVGGALVSAKGSYVVYPEADGQAILVLAVHTAGPFIDLLLPESGAQLTALVAGKPAAVVTPWPGARRRVLSLWRGPVEIQLDHGAGPFRLDTRAVPVSGPKPEVQLPNGWRQVGPYVGNLEVVMTDPLTVAVPMGAPWGAEAAGRVKQLFAAAVHIAMAPTVREPVVVLTAPEVEPAARAVAELWVPAYAPEAAWWEQGAVDFYTKKLLDQTKLWTSTADQTRWVKEHTKVKGYALALWLDASIRLDSHKERSLDDMFRGAITARTNKELIELARQTGSLSTSDHLDRMLRGREPLPVPGISN